MAQLMKLQSHPPKNQIQDKTDTKLRKSMGGSFNLFSLSSYQLTIKLILLKPQDHKNLEPLNLIHLPPTCFKLPLFPI